MYHIWNSISHACHGGNDKTVCSIGARKCCQERIASSNQAAKGLLLSLWHCPASSMQIALGKLMRFYSLASQMQAMLYFIPVLINFVLINKTSMCGILPVRCSYSYWLYGSRLPTKGLAPSVQTLSAAGGWLQQESL